MVDYVDAPAPDNQQEKGRFHRLKMDKKNPARLRGNGGAANQATGLQTQQPRLTLPKLPRRSNVPNKKRPHPTTGTVRVSTGGDTSHYWTAV